MASSLAARQAARQAMPPALNPQQAAAQPQGFLDRHRGTIENFLGFGGEAVQAWNQYQANQPKQNTDNIPETLKQLASGQKPQIPTLENAPAYDKTNNQLSETLKKLLGERMDRLDRTAGQGETNTDVWEQKAYQTADNQEGEQPVPSFGGTNFPWEKIGMAALNRLGGEPTYKEELTPGRIAAQDRNWLNNGIVGQAPAALEAGGRLAGRVAGAYFGGPAGAAAGGEVGAGVGNFVGSGIKRFGTVNQPERYT